ncbi:MAG TPA: fumarylacetoacetate hydrolase family protein [Candidatus Sumerlaeota bacterium]|nr:fumarylacetoacetate hydrolase family protein [Candidatus Sumerlaeota bacterium]HOR27325.1 fumarylacetoacetate hydrolase family protein [Candidatus Sumerlaeota bacterium]HPK02947.1 fumarylacetoacetate hydrolase family protein [Candidatus Sumerlaeota bacterium]
MRWVTYNTGKPLRAGLLIDDLVVDFEQSARALLGRSAPASVRAILEWGNPGRQLAERLLKRTRKLVQRIEQGTERRPAWLIPLDRVHLNAPVPDPEKVICLGLNYLEHCREQEGRLGRPVEPPKQPILFAKFASTLTGPYDPIVLPDPKVTREADYEVELAVVIGRTARGVSQRAAADHIAGYMVLDDVSARDCQREDHQWVRSKSFDTFAPCGPALVTPDEVPNPGRLALTTRLNGEVMQSSNTSDMIFKIPRIISFISQAITLKPGDIITTGTPPGVGAFREPPISLKPGDVVECEIEGLGVLRNVCRRG